MATINECLVALRARLAAFGYVVSSGAATFGAPEWQAVAVTAGSDIANKIGAATDPAMRLAACAAFQDTLGRQTPEQLTQFVFEQKKRLMGAPQPPVSALDPAPSANLKQYAPLAAGVGILGFGLFLAFRS